MYISNKISLIRQRYRVYLKYILNITQLYDDDDDGDAALDYTIFANVFEMYDMLEGRILDSTYRAA